MIGFIYIIFGIFIYFYPMDYKQYVYSVILIGALFIGATGCGSPKSGGQDSGDIGVENRQSVEVFSIKAAEGGEIVLKPKDGSSVKIVFPQGSLENDASLEVSTLNDQGEDILSAGFSLEQKGTGQSPSLKYPALLYFYANKDLGEDVSIVNNKEDGSFEIIPTNVSIKDGKTVLIAQVQHFSNYSARKVDPEAKQKAMDEDAQSEKDFNWVIYVEDSYDVDLGAMKRKVNLDFMAVNTSGNISGEYRGYAHANTSNDAEIGGGKIDADFQVKDDNVSFQLGPYIELGSLVPEDPNDPLAPLEPEKQPDLIGNGKVNMSGGGSGTVSAGGYSYGVSAKAETSNDPFDISVVGPLVRFSVSVQGVGMMYFDGYIIGEGK